MDYRAAFDVRGNLDGDAMSRSPLLIAIGGGAVGAAHVSVFVTSAGDFRIKCTIYGGSLDHGNNRDCRVATKLQSAYLALTEFGNPATQTILLTGTNLAESWMSRWQKHHDQLPYWCDQHSSHEADRSTLAALKHILGSRGSVEVRRGMGANPAALPLKKLAERLATSGINVALGRYQIHDILALA